MQRCKRKVTNINKNKANVVPNKNLAIVLLDFFSLFIKNIYGNIVNGYDQNIAPNRGLK